MDDFKHGTEIYGSKATFTAVNKSYRVTLTVERIDGKNITEEEGRVAYTSAAFPSQGFVGKAPWI
jgi:hypothetical protein